MLIYVPEQITKRSNLSLLCLSVSLSPLSVCLSVLSLLCLSVCLSVSLSNSRQNTMLVYVPDRYTKLLNLSPCAEFVYW